MEADARHGRARRGERQGTAGGGWRISGRCGCRPEWPRMEESMGREVSKGRRRRALRARAGTTLSQAPSSSRSVRGPACQHPPEQACTELATVHLKPVSLLRPEDRFKPNRILQHELLHQPEPPRHCQWSVSCKDVQVSNDPKNYEEYNTNG